MKEKIKEIIVVEGRDDEIAIKHAVDAHVLKTHGYYISNKLIATIKKYEKRPGIIIFTDPDFVGEKIRKKLSKEVPTAKHAFLEKSKATKNNNIGIENANPFDIIDALNKAKASINSSSNLYDMSDMIDAGLTGNKDSKNKRILLGEILGIGYASGNTFLKRLNAFQISKDDYNKALEEMSKKL